MSTIEPSNHCEVIGRFNNIAYVRHRGRFRGETVAGEYSVPYEITVPQDPAEGQRLFVFEPPHMTSGLIVRNSLLGEQLFFANGYSHAAVGYSNRAGHILNPTPGFELKIKGESIRVIPPTSNEREVSDVNIMRQFALALRQSTSDLFGEIQHVVATGASDSGRTIHDVYKPFGHKVFDLTMALTAPYVPPVNIKDQSPIIVFNTEADFDPKARPNPNFPAYSYYTVAGGPHIPDAVLTRKVFTGQGPPAIAGTTPINWLPFARALFNAGTQLIRNGKRLPSSTTLKLDSRGEIIRDERKNALGGIRHPALELREAQFIASVERNGWALFGDYRDPKQLTSAEFPGYLKLFTKAVDDLRDAEYLLPAGHARLLREVQLRPPNTYTLNYRDGLLLQN
jgi:hypothetical protein